MSSPSTLERTEERTSTGNQEPAHWVKNKGKVTEAYVLGTPLEALCGKTFIPKRDPNNRPVCQACEAIKKERDSE